MILITRSVPCTKFMPNVQQILTASYDKTVKIWDVPSQSPIISFEGHEVTHMLIQANYFTNLFI